MLASGGPIVKMPGTQQQEALRAYALHVSTDMPAGDKIINSTGYIGHQPNRSRAYSGVYFKSRTNYLPIHPLTRKALLAVGNCSVPLQKAASISRQGEEVETARRAGKPKTRVMELSKLSGVQAVLPASFGKSS